MATCNLTLQLKTRWWLPMYLKTLKLFCLMMQREPDYEKVSAFIVKHGISQKLAVEHLKK